MSTDESGGVIASIDRFKVNITEMVDFWTLMELFVNKDYACTVPPNTIVIDIGMNIGLASLWFAAMPNVDKVYGYEPFTKTYDRCLNNLALNPDLHNKIVANNFGVDGVDRDLELEYDDAQNTGSGVYGSSPRFRGSRIEKQIVHLKAAALVVAKIRADHPGKPIFLKIDCEGSEYDIIPNLVAAGELRGVVGLIMESHRADIDLLLGPLKERFSQIFYHYRNPPKVAMIYAAGERQPASETDCAVDQSRREDDAR